MTAEGKGFTITIEGIPEGWEPVQFRRPVAGDHYVDDMGIFRRWLDGVFRFGPRLILRKKYTPEPWLKEAGFKAIWRDEGKKWYASVEIPIWSNGWVGNYRTESICCRLNTLNFTPPELPEGAQDEDTLIEL